MISFPCISTVAVYTNEYKNRNAWMNACLAENKEAWVSNKTKEKDSAWNSCTRKAYINQDSDEGGAIYSPKLLNPPKVHWIQSRHNKNNENTIFMFLNLNANRYRTQPRRLDWVIARNFHSSSGRWPSSQPTTPLDSPFCATFAGTAYRFSSRTKTIIHWYDNER